MKKCNKQIKKIAIFVLLWAFFPYLFSLLVIQMASMDFRVLLNNARFVFIEACLLYYVLKKYFLPASIILKVITFILIYIFSFAVWCIILSVSATGQ